ncbi:hypothetical protein SNEBB_007949 [Seison nebaliae]|nr:hypothetical protein SNEBB_007949 [Seison nebaliae]
MKRDSNDVINYYKERIKDLEEENSLLFHQKHSISSLIRQEKHLRDELKISEERNSSLKNELEKLRAEFLEENEAKNLFKKENHELHLIDVENRKKIDKLLSLSGYDEEEITYFIKETPGKHILNEYVELVEEEKNSVQKSRNSLKKTLRYLSANGKNLNNPTNGSLIKEMEYQQLLTNNEQLKMKLNLKNAECKEESLIHQRKLEKMRSQIKELGEQSSDWERRAKHHERELEKRTNELSLTIEKLSNEFNSYKNNYRVEERRIIETKVNEDQLDEERKQIQKLKQKNYEKRIELEKERLSLEDELEQFKIKNHRLQLEQREGKEEVYKLKRKNDDLKNELREMKKSDEDFRKSIGVTKRKMIDRIKMLNEQYEKLEERKNKEIDGYISEIQQKNMEMRKQNKRLQSLQIETEQLNSRSDFSEMKLLKTMHKTMKKNFHAHNEVNNIKRQIYSLESELRET